MSDELHDPFNDQVSCARYRAERDMLAQAMERVADDIERTFSGYEGVEDAPAMRWARELRAALGSLHAPGFQKSRKVATSLTSHSDASSAPKVYDADCVEIREGDTVWDVYTGERMTVEGFKGTCGGYQTCLVTLESGEHTTCDGPRLTHRAPVIAADGRPLREGETVWGTGREQHEYVVLGQPGLGGGAGRFEVVCHDVTDDIDCDCDPDQLTHERPADKCRYCEHWQKDPSADAMGVCWFLYHEHEGEDCYAARLGDHDACEEFERRAKKLAGVSE